MNITEKDFGMHLGKAVKLFTLTNEKGLKVSVTNFGAILANMIVPDKQGIEKDVVLGFDRLEDYLVNHCYFGSTVGRNANRIKNAEFVLNGKTYHLDKNEGENNLHSGANCYNKRVWDYEVVEKENKVIFSILSPDLDQGFPGRLRMEVSYMLTNQNELVIEYKGVSDQDTICNLTNHSYFNLAGHESGTILDHILWLKADHFVPVDKQSIPLGILQSVVETPMDFRTPKKIGDDIEADFEQLQRTGGYDHSFAICKEQEGVEKVARVENCESGIIMDVLTDCVGVQFYAGNYINHEIGKQNTIYAKRSGFCLETGFFPDSMNQQSFPSPVIKANETYHTTTIYQFV